MKTSRLSLGDFDILSTLDSMDIENFELKKLSKGSTIYSDKLTYVMLKSGSAKLVFYEDGEEFIVYYMQKNNITVVDENCVLEVLEDSEVYTVNEEKFEKLLEKPLFCKQYTYTLLRIVLIQRSILKNILFENAKSRIASFLIELANEQNLKQNGFYYVFIPFSMKVLASFVGLRRQSASTAYNELIRDGVIRKITPHECLIVDYEKLESFT